MQFSQSLEKSLNSQERITTPVKTIAVSSGKGGVGKTNVAINVAAALSELGKRVMLLDADLGLANTDIMLGLTSRKNISHVLSGECELHDIIVQGPLGVEIIPAASGVPEMAELGVREQMGLIHAFSQLKMPPDILLVDTATGISSNVISLINATQEVILVVCDEPASITDTYAMIKLLSQQHQIRKISVLANMSRGTLAGKQLFNKLKRTTDRFLDVSLDYIGAIPYDNLVVRAIRNQRAVIEAYPNCPASFSFKQIAQKIQHWPQAKEAGGGIEFFVERLVRAASCE